MIGRAVDRSKHRLERGWCAAEKVGWNVGRATCDSELEFDLGTRRLVLLLLLRGRLRLLLSKAADD